MNEHMDELTAVAARAKRRFPDHRLETPPYRVCLPVYELVLKIIEMAEHDLSTVARFVLQLSNFDRMQPADFGRLLGLSERYVAGAAFELLKANLVVQSDRRIEITAKGKQTLSDGGKSMYPRNRYQKMPYDYLTKRIIGMDIKELLDGRFVQKNGFFVVRANLRRPRPSNLDIDEVKEYDRGSGRRHGKTEILEIAGIKDQRLKYRYDVVLVKLDGPNSSKPMFAAYRAQQYLEEESAAIQRLADRGADLVPEDLKTASSKPWAASISISSEESSILDAIDELDHKINQASQDAAEAKAIQEEAPKDQDQIDLADRNRELELQLKMLTNGDTRLIKTEEHHPLLLQAIEKASSELTLVSAWIDPYAFDDEVCRVLAAAIGRGVTVRIAWGFGVKRRGPEAARNRAKGNTALSKLRRLIPRGLKGNLVDKITETHEKFIICDDLFVCAGSFNWLSYRGKRDSGYRRETSYYSERQSDINLWKANAATLFGDA